MLLVIFLLGTLITIMSTDESKEFMKMIESFKRTRPLLIVGAGLILVVIFLLLIGVTTVPIVFVVFGIALAYSLGQWQQDKQWRNWHQNVLMPIINEHNEKEHAK